jgi:WD40 repeat protein
MAGVHAAVEGDRRGRESSAHEVSAAAVAWSLLTGRFARLELDPGAVSGGTSDSQSPPSPTAPPGLTQPLTATAADRDPGQVGTAAAPSASGDNFSTVSLPRQADLSSLSASARGYWHGVARIGLQVAEALAYAHGQRILHRDIKPSNLLLDAHGNVWVADFGLAKSSEGEDLTHTGDVVGTLRYLAPERLRGQSDPRGDIYSLGLTLYELLTLRPAFDATDRERLIHQVTQGEPPRPRQLEPGLPRDLETIVLKAIAREPGHRYATATALGEDLQRFLEGRPIRARRISAVERVWLWCRRNPGIAGLSASIAALLVLAALGSSIAAVRFRRLAQAERQAQDELEENLYFNRISLAAREMEAHNEGRVEELLEECPHRLRGWEWYYLRRIPIDRPLVLRGHTGRFAAVAFSPGGERLASIAVDMERLSDNGELKVWDIGSPRQIWSARINVSGVRVGVQVALAFSPDGQRLATPDLDRNSDRSCDIKVWDAATGRDPLLLKGHADLVVGLGFSSDGARIVSADSGGFVRLWDPTTGLEIGDFPTSIRSLFSLAYHPDGRRVALGGADGAVSLWDTTTGRKVCDLRGFDTRTTCLAFDREGTHLAAGSAQGDVRIWNTASGQEPRDLPKLPANVFGVAFNPDPSVSRLAMSSGDGTIRLWDLRSSKEALTFRATVGVLGISFSPEGQRLAMARGDQTIRIVSAAPIANATAFGPLLEFRPGGRSSCGAVYSPDGTRLATVDEGEGRGRANHLRVSDAEDGRTLLHVEGIGSGGRAVGFSSDGKRLATVDADGSVRLRDATTGRVLHTLGQVKATCLAFSPDGRWIAVNDEGIRQVTKVVIWDARTGHSGRPLDAGATALHGLAFSPDGRLVAAISRDLRLRVWDVMTCQRLWSKPAHLGWAGAVAFSPDGQQIATGGFGEDGLKIWDSATGRRVSTLPGRPGFASSIAYSSDCRFLASGSTDKTVRIWDLATGQEARTLVGHTDWVSGVSFRRDGGRLASSSDDGTIKIWDLTRLSRGLENRPDGTHGRSDMTGRGRLR